MPRNFATDDALVEQVQAARSRRESLLSRADEGTARRAAELRAGFSHLRPGETLALARDGRSPDDDLTREAARRRAVVKKRKGLGWHTIGSVVKAAGSATSITLGLGAKRAAARRLGSLARPVMGGIAEGADFLTPETVENAIGRGVTGAGDRLKQTARGVATVAQSGAQAVDLVYAANVEAVREKGVLGWATSGLAGTRDEGERSVLGATTAGLAIEDIRAGRRVELGSGFLPGKKATERQAEVARTFGTIDGKAITPGRHLTTFVAEPGTKPYNFVSGLIDAGVDIKLDPSAGVALGTTAARRGARLLVDEKEMLIDGVRKTVRTSKVAEFLDSQKGARLVEDIAAEPSFDRLWRRMGKKAPVEDVLALADLDDPLAVRRYLDDALGTTIREKPSLRGVPFANPVVRRVRDARLWQGVPGRKLNFDDPDEAVKTVDDFLRNVNIRDPEVIGRHTEAIARATVGGSGAQRYEALNAVVDAVEEAVVASGLPKAKARELTTLWKNQHDELRAFNITDIGEDAWFPGVRVDEADRPTASPHLIVEALNSSVPLPDPRELRRAVSKWRPALETVDVPVMVLENAMGQFWRPFTLLRPAAIPRIVGEEQGRMAGAGFDSFFNHPLSALATVVADTGRVGFLLSRVGVQAGRKDVDIKGELFADAARLAPNPTELERALYKGKPRDIRTRAGFIRASGVVRVTKDDPRYRPGWANELMTLRVDPIARRVAQGGLDAGDRSPSNRTGIDGIKDWFWEGAGRGLREDIVTQSIDPTTAPTSRYRSDQYVDVMLDRLEVATGGHPDLLDAVVTGRIGEVPLRSGDEIDPRVVDVLEQYLDAGPMKVKADLDVFVGRKTLMQKYNSVVDTLFSLLWSRPSNLMSRSPVFRQAYWKRIDELMPFLDEPTQEQVIRMGREAKLTREELRSLAAGALGGKGKLDLDHADGIAKGFALEQTKTLLYDLSAKGQFFDQLRLIFPFGEAWKEVITRWSGIVTENPVVLRRAQQVIEGARGNGFFAPDPTTGEEMFTYPGSRWVSEQLFGVPVGFKGRVAGLSLATNVLPGFGPVVQVPAAELMPDKPEWDWVREAVLPFGEQETEGGFIESLLPPGLQKFRTAGLLPFAGRSPEQVRLWNNTVKDTADWLLSTGEYSTETPEDVERLLTDARRKAKALYVYRGIAQYFVPSAPSPEFLAYDSDGGLMVARKLVEEFHNLQVEDYETAVERFLDRYGEEALLYMQPKTEGGTRPTDLLGEWARRHEVQVKRFPNVYGFFGPQGGEFDQGFYNRQIRSGERKPLSPEEAVARANGRVASMLYRRAKEQVAGRTDAPARRWLAEVREELQQQYPGYDPFPKNLGRLDRMIGELERAVADPTLATTSAGQAIADYLDARSAALAAARDDLNLTGGFQRAKKAAYLREWLRSVAEEITAEHPDFAEVFETVFDREMVDDAVDEEPA